MSSIKEVAVAGQSVSAKYSLGFTAGDRVSVQDVLNYRDAVNSNASSVCQGIVAALAAQKLKATVQQFGSQWSITVVSATSPQAVHEEVMAENNPPVTANIGVTANLTDVPAVVTALNNFFSNWRAVAGFMATAATVVGAIIALRVTRR